MATRPTHMVTRPFPPLLSHTLQAAVLGGRLFVVGGVNEARTRLASVEALDLREKKWTAVPPMSHARSSCSAAVRAGCYYMAHTISACTPLHLPPMPSPLPPHLPPPFTLHATPYCVFPIPYTPYSVFPILYTLYPVPSPYCALLHPLAPYALLSYPAPTL